MQYPRQFPAKSRAVVEAERVKAKRELEKAQAAEPPPEWKRSKRPWDHCAFNVYILRVFLTFAKEACELGNDGTWTMDRIRTEAESFLRDFALLANSENGRDRFGEGFGPVVSNWTGSLLPEIERRFKESDEWRQFEDKLLMVAQRVAGSTDDLGAPLPGVQPRVRQSSPAFWRSRRDEFEQLSKRQRESLGVDREHPKWLRGYCSRLEVDELAFCEIEGGLDGELRSRFEDIATQAGIALASAPGADPVRYWVSCLCLDLLHNWAELARTELLQSPPGGGIIRDLLMSSSAYCSRLAALAERQAHGHPAKIELEASDNLPLPPGFKSEQIEDVFKSSATFCQVRAFAEAGPPLPQRATDDISGNSRVPGSVEQSSHKETAIGVNSSLDVPPLNPFAPSDPRYDAWAELALKGPGRLKSAADNVAGDNEQISGALTALLKAPPPERDQLWKEVLPILRRRRPHADFPDITPLDDNEIVGMFTPALDDPETAVLNRFATQSGEALSRFVLCEKDIDAYIEMVGYLAESALAVVSSPSDRFRDQISDRRKRLEADAKELVSETTARPGHQAQTAPKPADRPGREPNTAKLDAALIKARMDDEGFTNETLGERLKISPRTVSSMRNNGDYHGLDAVTKLANLMGRDASTLYLP